MLRNLNALKVAALCKGFLSALVFAVSFTGFLFFCATAKVVLAVIKSRVIRLESFMRLIYATNVLKLLRITNEYNTNIRMGCRVH
jgi:hypothetical protein